jgi:hypothetical protein
VYEEEDVVASAPLPCDLMAHRQQEQIVEM